MVRTEFLEIPISIGTYADFVDTSVSKGMGYTCFLNVHMATEFHRNSSFAPVLKNADFVVTDGMPIVYSLRAMKGIKQERIAGNDAIFSLIDKAEKDRLSIYMIGSTESVLNKISEQMSTKGIRHASYSPPFLPIEEFDFDHQSQMINEFNPDMVFVGLGCPKQETWMHRMRDKVRAPMYGLGGAFLLYAGVDKRAPEWMRKLSLEWFYRLLLEPRRLLKRYAITNTYFLGLLARYWLNR